MKYQKSFFTLGSSLSRHNYIIYMHEESQFLVMQVAGALERVATLHQEGHISGSEFALASTL